MEVIGEKVEDDLISYGVVGGHDKKRILYAFGSYAKVVPMIYGTTEVSNYIPKKIELQGLKEFVKQQQKIIINKELKEIMKVKHNQHKIRIEELDD